MGKMQTSRRDTPIVVDYGSQTVDANNDVPLYIQVKEILRQQIRTGAWKPGDRIPSEAEIRQQFAVGRATVRQALTELKMEGYLMGHQGKGTFVCKPKIETQLHGFYSFTQDMENRGLHPETRLIQFEVIVRRPSVAVVFGLGEKDPLIKLVRLRLAGGDPIMLETTYIPEHIAPDLCEEEVSTHSLYTLLEEKYGICPARAVESFEPILVDDFSAKWLEVPKGSPALYLERIGSLANGQRIELSQSVVRGDRSRYVVELLR